ncbi:MAG: discoidin domain-containing protein [Candidatus Eremiobacteraeota bacterium]|nr:discoidin domain-containing protein [Candidatus Eremiobacteraeota bacterium]
MLLGADAEHVDSVVVDASPSHRLATFRPLEAFGSTVDKEPAGSIPALYSRANVRAMLGAGLGWLSYRLYSELSVQDWHWNPRGSFSAGDRGYWTSNAVPKPASIDDSYQYALAHSGFTTDQGDSNAYSRLDDGDPATYWKSNPYLTSRYTHESDALHPQWAVVDLGTSRPVNDVRIAWGNPYATAYALAYWTGSDAMGDPGHGAWEPFTLHGAPVKARFVRVLMTRSSNTCDTHGAGDPRNCAGYAIREIAIGRTDASGFTDYVHHVPGRTQSLTYVSSVDPWHTAASRVGYQEQPGLDLIARSGLTRNAPATYPVPMLYSTPENAVAEVRYLLARGYPIRSIELGEEPDGQYVTPEDDAALYVQWSRAIAAAAPNLKLGGPVFSGANDDVQAWPDAAGDVSWLHRFLGYLRSHRALDELSFFSFEHYPYDGCEHAAKLRKDLENEPALMRHITGIWRGDGLPPDIPMYVTEANFSAVNFTQVPMQIQGGLWLADYFASALSNGVSGVVYYQYEPVPLSRNKQCPADWGNLTMFVADRSARIRATNAQYRAAQMLAQQWVVPGNQPHELFRATSSPALSAYAVHRPDGTWSVMFVNKDVSARTVAPTFAGMGGTAAFGGAVTEVTYGSAQYEWHAGGAASYASPNRPPLVQTIPAAATYSIPAESITVLRGNVVPTKGE